MWLAQHKPWFHILLGVILALALTASLNLLAARFGEKFDYTQPVKAMVAQSVEQSLRSTQDLTLGYVGQQPSLLLTVIFGALVAFVAASIAYLTLNRIIFKE
jgi:hypothetical protein